MSMPALGTWKTRAMTPSSAGRLSFAAAPLLVLRGGKIRDALQAFKSDDGSDEVQSIRLERDVA
jgi:hypothetical protein